MSILDNETPHTIITRLMEAHLRRVGGCPLGKKVLRDVDDEDDVPSSGTREPIELETLLWLTRGVSPLAMNVLAYERTHARAYVYEVRRFNPDNEQVEFEAVAVPPTDEEMGDLLGLTGDEVAALKAEALAKVEDNLTRHREIERRAAVPT